MARLSAAGAEVHAIIVTRGQEPAFPAEYVERVKAETRAAHAVLGVHETHWLDLPAAALDTLPVADVNSRIAQALAAIAPDTLFVPFIGDIHIDHQAVFTASLVWARPRNRGAPTCILAYETLSETNWHAPGVTPAFIPNIFVDIAGQLETKLAAFARFESQVRDFPDERSLIALRALALMRGATAYCEAAEAFMAIRQVWSI